jgi:hypothetical protein
MRREGRCWLIAYESLRKQWSVFVYCSVSVINYAVLMPTRERLLKLPAIFEILLMKN